MLNPQVNDQGQTNVAAAGTGLQGIIQLGQSPPLARPQIKSRLSLTKLRHESRGRMDEAKIPARPDPAKLFPRRLRL